MVLIIIVTILIVVSFFSCLYIIKNYIKNSSSQRVLLAISIVPQLFIITTLIIVYSKVHFLSHKDLMWIFFYYILISATATSFATSSWLMRIVVRKTKNTRISTYTALIIATGIFSVMIYGATIGRTCPTINTVEISHPLIPNSFDGYKIVQISDLHLGNYGNNTNVIERVVKMVNNENADIIAITGDLANIESKELIPFIEALSKISAKDGVYSVLGNHDYGDYKRWKSEKEKKQDLTTLIDMQKNMGWKMLNNNNSKIARNNDYIYIIGVENWGLPPYKIYGDLNSSVPLNEDGIFKILLSHNPTHWEHEVKDKTDIALTLSGHTHAMQMKFRIFGKNYSPASLIYNPWHGLVNNSDSTQYLYINEGIGVVGAPMRIGSPPEITVFTLKSLH